MEDDHYYTRDTVNKLLKQKLVIKRASTDSRLTPEIRFNENKAESKAINNWPMLTLRNDFA